MTVSKTATRTRKRKQVALLIETSNAYAREMLRGIQTFARENRHWSLHLTEQGRGDAPPSWIRSWHGDGIIARIETSSVAETVRQTAVPVVNVSASELVNDFPTVISDSAAIARLAAEHLLERGFRSFGYCGDARFAWSGRHGEHFTRHIKTAGYDCAVFDSHPSDSENWDVEQRKLADWIRSLPKPAGVMTCYDIRGQQLLDACRAVGVLVPDDVAVVGQHNDELLCDLCEPPLSSVIPNARRAGFEAAALLDKLMWKKSTTAPATLLIEPLGVETRQSTDVLNLNDPHIAAAVRYIREHACEQIGVEDARKVSSLSRTLFERRFRKLLGCSPYEQILKIRMDKARELLSLTNLSLAEIAERTGFSTPEYFSAAMHKRLNIPPSEYRHRLKKGRSYTIYENNTV